MENQEKNETTVLPENPEIMVKDRKGTETGRGSQAPE